MPFFGRARELEQLLALLREPDPDVRRVTVVGPPGIGKTRLAIEATRRLRSAQPDRRVAVCPLGAARDAADASDAFAGAVGAESSAAALGGLAESNAPVIVLDGADAAPGAARELAGRALDASPDGLVLATSRVRLGAPGERLLELGPLDAPAAVELLADAIAGRGATLDDRDRELLPELARDLEGVPLALELAAARAPVLGVRALVHRLRSGPGAGLESLERALAGTLQGLEAHERAALAQLTVFRGGFDVADAEGVLALPPGAPPVEAVLDALLARSLLRRLEDGRLTPYRPARDAGARTLAPGDAAALRERFARWYAERAPRADRGWLLAERENLRAAVATVLDGEAVTPRRAAPALRVLVAALPVLVGAAPLDGFDALLDPVLEATKASGVDAALLVRAAAARGVLRRHRGRAREGAEDLVRALAMLRASRAPEAAPAEADLVRELGWALAEAGRAAEAREHFERAARLSRESGDAAGEGRALAGEAALQHASLELEQAATLLERAGAVSRADPVARAEHLRALAAVRVDAGDHAAAGSALADAEDLARAGGDRRCGAEIEATRGALLLDAGDLHGARAALERAAAPLAELGASRAHARVLGALGVAAHLAGRGAEAWALLSQAASRLAGDPLAAFVHAHLALLDTGAGRAAQAAATLEALAAQPAAQSSPAGERALDVARGRPRSDTAELSRRSAWLRATLRCSESVRAPAPPSNALLVARDGTWFCAPGGERTSLDRRRPLARVLAALAAAAPAALTPAELLAAGWPGEKVLPAAGAHRVRVAVATLRKLGLQGRLVTVEQGYGLSPGGPLTLA